MTRIAHARDDGPAPEAPRTPGRRTWLLLMHQLPAEPAYLRVKVLRRLRAVGAIAIRNSAYVLPESDETREDFQWIRREIVDAGGEATISVTNFLEGVSDAGLEGEFCAERNTEYAELAAAARSAAPREAERSRLRKRLHAIVERDFFGAEARLTAEEAMRELETRRGAGERREVEPLHERPAGAMWVTRAGARIDRLASAWLILRFIDPAARFRFVAPEGYVHEPGELRFDMFEGEYTHEGDRCTFETLMTRFGVGEAGISPIAEIVHDIDCKDDRYGRPETAGIAGLITGIASSHPRDEDRIAAALPIFDALQSRFRDDPNAG